LAEVEKLSGPAAANRARAALSAYFNWLAREGYISTNPVSFTNKAIEPARALERLTKTSSGSSCGLSATINTARSSGF
jgi:hypothetical protein